ncbi:uncharacterized protein LOC132306216 isoform X2 [Cornus florida]|uniref:uncharacterized protein LOC132306216 isoform X2 n=1 Tax=Cornus florida TaxID=4283 RepID=UPI0028A26826|nr:uncharacterized protein LOC132306216 isoform X2 [Cornus florida]
MIEKRTQTGLTQILFPSSRVKHGIASNPPFASFSHLRGASSSITEDNRPASLAASTATDSVAASTPFASRALFGEDK